MGTSATCTSNPEDMFNMILQKCQIGKNARQSLQELLQHEKKEPRSSWQP